MNAASAQPASPRACSFRAASNDSIWPPEEPAYRPDPHDIDDDTPLELDDDYWEALLPDDDYEPYPAPGDFWTDP